MERGMLLILGNKPPAKAKHQSLHAARNGLIFPVARFLKSRFSGDAIV
jgi:hypothetical protein